jgi:NAD+ kinase
MSESVDGAVVAVVGEPSQSVRDAVAAAGVDPVFGAPGSVLDADPDVVLAVGAASLPGLVVPDPPSCPVLPVETGPGTPALPADELAAGLDAVLAGEFASVSTPVLDVAVDGESRTRALADVMLVTAEPARISEYAVATGDTTVADFRADGVVVATPLGSHGYARRVEGPVVAPGTGVAAVVPIAPFATDADHWVVAEEDIELRVARDEHDVELHADDRTVGPVPAGVPVTVSASATLELVSLPASRNVFGADEA